MKQRTYILVWVLIQLVVGRSFAQSGADPSVIDRKLYPLTPTGLPGINAAFTLYFKVGNLGAIPISGIDEANKMGFIIQLSKCAPSPLGSGTFALTGTGLTQFDVTYNETLNTFTGVQKQGVPIPPYNMYELHIALQVTQSSPTEQSIGGSCQIIPNSTANPEPTANNFAYSYTRENGKIISP